MHAIFTLNYGYIIYTYCEYYPNPSIVYNVVNHIWWSAVGNCFEFKHTIYPLKRQLGVSDRIYIYNFVSSIVRLPLHKTIWRARRSFYSCGV